MNQRLDLYRNVHKGIRVMLFDIVRESGHTDFTSAPEVARLQEQVAGIFELLESHAHTEDRFMMPLVERLAPALAKEFGSAHEEQESLLPGLLADLRSIDPMSADAEARGHQFAVRLSRIAGELLVHMADEELEINPALWSAMSDEELGQVERELVGSIPPEKMARYLRVMLPAMNPGERVTFLGHLPPPVFAFVRALATEVLSVDEEARLERDLAVTA
jgi:hypothetical protein